MRGAESPAPALLFEQVRGGIFTIEALRWVSAAFEQYHLNDGVLPMERCLKLQSKKQRRRQQRNYHLIRLARLVGDGSCGHRAAAVGRLVDTFARGPWRELQKASAPPLEADEQREHLFYLMRSLSGQPRPGDKAIELILRSADLEEKTA